MQKRDSSPKEYLTPRLICERLGVGVEPVLAWIHSGQLKAFNISSSSLRPRWRISKTDFQAFLDARSNQRALSNSNPS